MNWRKIDENWKKFTENYQLESSRDENNYFYGYQDIYIAKEKLNDFEIYYENRFNKSTELGSSVGHAIMICSLISTNKDWNLEVKKNSFWKRLLGKDDKLKIKANSDKVKELLPIKDIELLMSGFSDLKISIKNFDKNRHDYIPHGQKVLLMKTSHQPERYDQIEMFRNLSINLLTKLNKKGLIKPAHNTKCKK